MAKELNTMLDDLQAELHRIGRLDAEMEANLAALREEIDALLDPENPNEDSEGVVEQLNLMLTNFDSEHHTFMVTLKSIINALSNAGI